MQPGRLSPYTLQLTGSNKRIQLVKSAWNMTTMDEVELTVSE